MLTIKDIAKEAGVSTATVSRTLNNSGYVSKETRERIEKVIRKSNFSPSAMARSLSNGKTNTVGVIVPDATNPFYSEILKGITRMADKKNLTIIFCDSDEDTVKEEKALLMLREQRVCGLILTPTVDYNDRCALNHYKKLVNNLNIPVVLLDRPIEHVNWDGVFFDGFNGSYMAVEKLIAEGHRKIANITSDLKIKIARERFAGYKQALIDNGIEIDEKYIFKSDFTVETSYRLAKQCLSMEDPPTAVHTNNNQSSLGFLKAVQEMGLRIPEDISYMGFDKLEVLDSIGIRYSYVGRDTEGMGSTAMRMLLERIAHDDCPKQEIYFPPELVMIGSEKMHSAKND